MVSYNVSKENLEASKKVTKGKRPQRGGRQGGITKKRIWKRPPRLRHAAHFFSSFVSVPANESRRGFVFLSTFFRGELTSASSSELYRSKQQDTMSPNHINRFHS